MDISAFLKRDGEKPLDVILPDGGFAAIFRTIACVGDSLSSGEYQLKADKGFSYHDYYEYSWGQFMARMLGSTVYNFSRGGMSAREYCNYYADANNLWDGEKAAQCYIIALGVNDVSAVMRNEIQFGSVEDIKEDYSNNAETFVGYYAKIIAKYKTVSPYAKFFLVTCPDDTDDKNRSSYYDLHQKTMYELAKKFDNTYVLDLRKYAPEYNAEFKENFYHYGHMVPTGYLLTAKMMASYIDYIIRNNPADFKGVGLINKDIQDKISEM